MSAPTWTSEQLREMIRLARQLGFTDDVVWLQEQLDRQEGMS